jgi:hypothetical protein
MPKYVVPSAQIVWFDPGVTTGMCVVSLDPEWLDGADLSSWATLRKHIQNSWHAQIGRHARVWEDGKAVSPKHPSVCGKPGSIRTRVGNRGDFAGTMAQILKGEGAFGGGDLTTGQAEEVSQIINCQNLLDAWPEAAWGYEDFVPRALNQGREFLAPVRIFATLTFSELVHGHRARVPFVQQASMAKTTATDERLSAAGLYRPGMPHATDAARHALTFARRARADKEIRKAAWPHLF